MALHTGPISPHILPDGGLKVRCSWTSLPGHCRTRVRRLPKRGHYDRDTVHAVLDAGVLCHVGYVIDGQPYVTPTCYWRHGDRLYWHGSSASRMLRHLKQGVPACVTVTHLDGFVLARSGFHHSVNYRSVMAFGRARLVPDEDKLGGARGLRRAPVPGPLGRSCGRRPGRRSRPPRCFGWTWTRSRPRSGPGRRSTTRRTTRCRSGRACCRSRPCVGAPEPDPRLAAGHRGAGLSRPSAPRCCGATSARRPEPQRTQGRSPRTSRTLRVSIPSGSSQSARPPAAAQRARARSAACRSGSARGADS